MIVLPDGLVESDWVRQGLAVLDDIGKYVGGFYMQIRRRKSASKNVMLQGRTPFVLDDVRHSLAVQNVTLFAGTTLDEVIQAFDENSIDIVIMGAGLPLEVRLQIVKHIFTFSNVTTVQMKDRDSGKQGMLPFVNGILKRLVG